MLCSVTCSEETAGTDLYEWRRHLCLREANRPKMNGRCNQSTAAGPLMVIWRRLSLAQHANELVHVHQQTDKGDSRARKVGV